MTEALHEPLMHKVRELLEDISGTDLDDLTAETEYVEIGLDSLLLTQAATSFKRAFGVEVSFRQLNDELSTPGALVSYLAANIPETKRAEFGGGAADSGMASRAPTAAEPAPGGAPMPVPAPAPIPAPVQTGPAALAPPALAATPGPVANGAIQDPGVAGILLTQLQLMQQQLGMLLGAPQVAAQPQPTSAVMAQPAAAQPAAHAQAPAAGPAKTATNGEAKSEKKRGPTNVTPDGKTTKTFGAQARIEKEARKNDPETQRRLSDFIRSYEEKNRKSKAFTAEHRSVLADPRVVSGFRPDIKEITFPVVVERSRGVRLHDVDGNEYIDLVNGFGSNFFGYAPDFVREAVKQQLDTGIEIGPQSAIAGRAAKKLAEMIGHERVAFCNTGSEAVLGAVRTARTVTGNDEIIMFAGGYHGIFDEVVVRGTPSLKSMPAAAGIPRGAVGNITVLEYDSEESLKIIDERGPNLAAVLVEPVQSRRPELQPKAFMHKVREITAKHGAAMIMDEIVTGFRIAPGGSQEYFGIDADLGTYGKAFGGGMPIGAIGGKRRFMDALDGGGFEYGDESVPEVGVTYFAGTFVRFPLALAAAEACLDYMKAEGPELQKRLNARSDDFAHRLSKRFEELGAPLYFRNFGSLMKLDVTEDLPYGGLYFHACRMHGVHVLEGRPIFLTLAHTDEDLAQVEEAMVAAARQMQDLGFFPPSKSATPSNEPPVPGARLGRDPDGSPAWYVPDPERPGKYRRVASYS